MSRGDMEWANGQLTNTVVPWGTGEWTADSELKRLGFAPQGYLFGTDTYSGAQLWELMAESTVISHAYVVLLDAILDGDSWDVVITKSRAELLSFMVWLSPLITARIADLASQERESHIEHLRKRAIDLGCDRCVEDHAMCSGRKP